jgi:hypothetical protein
MGETGPAGKIYYDNVTHVMHDFEEYWATRERPPVVVKSADVEF